MPRGLALAIAMAGSSDVVLASHLPSHAITTIESKKIPSAFEVVQSIKADEDSDDSGDDDF